MSQSWFHESEIITARQTKYQEKGVLFADKYFPSVFDYHWLEGDYKIALAKHDSIVITECLAHKYFGNEEASRQRINLDNHYKGHSKSRKQ